MNVKPTADELTVALREVLSYMVPDSLEDARRDPELAFDRAEACAKAESLLARMERAE